MGIFSKGGGNSGPDPALVAAREAAAAKAERERQAQAQAAAEEQKARARGLRGFRSLLSGGFTGFPGGSTQSLGPSSRPSA